MSKKMLRLKTMEKLDEMSIEIKRNDTGVIHNHLYNYSKWKNAKVVGTTISFGNEVDTFDIIRHAWGIGKQVVVPKCSPEDRQLSFYLLNSFQELSKGYFGLLEPNPAISKQVNPEEIDLLLVPGVVFDRKGYRIGHGGGYYDRFLLKNRTIPTCSLCYDLQLREELPKESHDMPVDVIITEQEVIHTIKG